jgi:Fe-S cluster assembly protein SufD
METVRTDYLERLLSGHAGLPAGPRDRLRTLRADALEHANALPAPTTRDEEWRFTDLSPLYRTTFQRAEAAPRIAAAELAGLFLPEAAGRLVFVDGHYAGWLSQVPRKAGLVIGPLAAAAEASDPFVSRHLGRCADFRAEAFVALNTAWLQDGAFITIAGEHAAAEPVHLLFVSTRPETVSHPRILVVAQPGSDCVLVEDYVSLHEGAYLTNAVAEIAVEANARIAHVRLQREAKAAFHISTCAVRLERDADYQGVSVTLGGRLSRHNVNVVQAGEGAECRLDGLALIDGRQLADTHSVMDHARRNGRSRQVHKCIVGGAAHAVFNGKIFVREGAQLTDSAQESRNLLLTDKAHVDTKPQLEIFADDVKCAHGATVGQLDPDQLFYLTSRGLDAATARELLTFAFAAEIVQRVPVPSLVKRLEETVVRQTKGKRS